MTRNPAGCTGWYHQEIETDCPQGRRTWPQIGAAISEDDGESWNDVGVVLTPREGSVTCDTEHPVTNGGIGDFSVILDRDPDPARHYLYFIFSSYGGDLEEQGISFARMPWSERDRPFDRFSGQSQVSKWDGTGWGAPGIGGRSVAIFHDSRQVSWTTAQNNGYWGPSVHWNSDLQKFVVLMDRSKGGNYADGRRVHDVHGEPGGSTLVGGAQADHRGRPGLVSAGHRRPGLRGHRQDGAGGHRAAHAILQSGAIEFLYYVRRGAGEHAARRTPEADPEIAHAVNHDTLNAAHAELAESSMLLSAYGTIS